MANNDGVYIPADRMIAIKKEIAFSILKFFMYELTENSLDAEQKESLSVAKQCLEACYEIEEHHAVPATDLTTLFYGMKIPPPPEISARMEADAEQHKINGNEAMKEGKYEQAIDFYNQAIVTNGRKAIYYCNRAAAFSRLNMDDAAIADCKQAIKLDPKYGKAYGRLGIAYSNMNLYKEAADAYRNALKLDPTNASYEANLKLALEKIKQPGAPTGTLGSTPGAGIMGGPMNFDFTGFMNNPALLSMASQMLSDPSFRNMVSGIMTSGPGGDPNLDSFVEVGQQLAEHMQANNPNVMETLRQTYGARGGDSNNPDAPPSDAKPDEKKND